MRLLYNIRTFINIKRLLYKKIYRNFTSEFRFFFFLIKYFRYFRHRYFTNNIFLDISLTNSLIFLFVLILLAFSLHFLHLDFFSTPTIPSNLPSPVAPVEIEPIVPKSPEVNQIKELTEQEKQEARILADKLFTKKLAVVSVVLWGFVFLGTITVSLLLILNKNW